ncbi:hypothetical protein JW948_03915 [bacterium]|nr:hypothetical protein [bacterium]
MGKGEYRTVGTPVYPSIRSLAVNSNDHLFAGGSIIYKSTDGMYRSTDNGATWTEINGGFPWVPYVLDVFIPVDGVVLAGTTDGAFLSTDAGASWKDVSDGFTGHVTAVLSFTMDSAGYLYASTRFSGVFRSSSPIID